MGKRVGKEEGEERRLLRNDKWGGLLNNVGRRVVVVCSFWIEVGVEAPVKVKQNTMKMMKRNEKYTGSLVQ